MLGSESAWLKLFGKEEKPPKAGGGGLPPPPGSSWIQIPGIPATGRHLERVGAFHLK